MVGGIIPLRWAQSSRYGGRLRPESAKNLEHHHRIERRTATLRSVRIRKRRVEFRPERLEIHHNPKGLEPVTKVAQTLQPIIDIKKTRLVAHRIVSHPPPGWNQKCSNLARFLEPSRWTLLLTRPYCVVERFRLASAPDFVGRKRPARCLRC